MPDYFQGVMQRYFFSYMAALHLSDQIFIQQVSKPGVDYDTLKTKFLSMIQQLPESLLEEFFKRNNHALKNIPSDLSYEQLLELGKKGFNIITKNGHDFYNEKILQCIEKAFEFNKNHISKDLQDFFKLDPSKQSHQQVLRSLGEQIQSYIENEESLQQQNIKVICQFLSGPYTIIEVPAEQQAQLEQKVSLFCPHYSYQSSKTVPILLQMMIRDCFMPISQEIDPVTLCQYTNSLAGTHLQDFRNHTDKANRLVFALDQLRVRYQNMLNNNPA
jgi:hypothetical protein